MLGYCGGEGEGGEEREGRERNNKKEGKIIF